MRILIYGAGVIGSVFAARLHGAGHEVSVLARGRRLAQIREHGILLEAAGSGKRFQARASAVERLAPDDAYDLVLVAMQKGQIASVLPVLAESRNTPTVAFFGNNAAGPSLLTEALGTDRVLLGFPSVGGYFEGPTVRYASDGSEVDRVGATLGELDGRTTARLRGIVDAFAAANIHVVIEQNMDAWLKGHVALVVPILYALNRHGRDNMALARDRTELRKMTTAVREGLAVLRRLGHPITPFKLKAISWLPVPVSAAIFSRILASDFAKVAFAGHAENAAAEFELLLEELRELIRQSGLATPALDELCSGGAPAEPPGDSGGFSTGC